MSQSRTVSRGRIGYVNVQGLTKPTWDACQKLLASRFDFLFLAETWFVNYKHY